MQQKAYEITIEEEGGSIRVKARAAVITVNLLYARAAASQMARKHKAPLTIRIYADGFLICRRNFLANGKAKNWIYY